MLSLRDDPCAIVLSAGVIFCHLARNSSPFLLTWVLRFRNASFCSAVMPLVRSFSIFSCCLVRYSSRWAGVILSHLALNSARSLSRLAISLELFLFLRGHVLHLFFTNSFLELVMRGAALLGSHVLPVGEQFLALSVQGVHVADRSAWAAVGVRGLLEGSGRRRRRQVILAVVGSSKRRTGHQSCQYPRPGLKIFQISFHGHSLFVFYS